MTFYITTIYILKLSIIDFMIYDGKDTQNNTGNGNIFFFKVHCLGLKIKAL